MYIHIHIHIYICLFIQVELVEAGRLTYIFTYIYMGRASGSRRTYIYIYTYIYIGRASGGGRITNMDTSAACTRDVRDRG